MSAPHVIQNLSFSVSPTIVNPHRPFISHVRAYSGTNTPYLPLPNKPTLTQRPASTNRAILCLSRPCVRILPFRDLRVRHHISVFDWLWPRVVRRPSPVDDSPSLTIDEPPLPQSHHPSHHEAPGCPRPVAGKCDGRAAGAGVYVCGVHATPMTDKTGRGTLHSEVQQGFCQVPVQCRGSDWLGMAGEGW